MQPDHTMDPELIESSPIFICGQPRSGTTLWQRLLNSTGEVVIYGEHVGFLKGIAASFHSIFEHPSVHKNPENNNYFRKRDPAELYNVSSFDMATHAGFSKSELMTRYRTFVSTSINAHKVAGRWGFKEIHYGINDDVVAFLLKIFPAAQFIFIIRNPADQIVSKMSRGWWPNYSFEDNVDIWTAQARNFQDYCTRGPRSCHLVRYEDFIKDTLLLKNIFEKLGLDFLPKQQDLVLRQAKVGETPAKFPITTENASLIKTECSKSGIYDRSEIERAIENALKYPPKPTHVLCPPV